MGDTGNEERPLLAAAINYGAVVAETSFNAGVYSITDGVPIDVAQPQLYKTLLPDTLRQVTSIGLRYAEENYFELSNTLPKPPSLKDKTFLIAYGIALLAASIYLGPNWFENKRDGRAMMFVHTLASLLYNILLNGYYGEDTCRKVPAQVKLIMTKIKQKALLDAFVQSLDLIFQTVFSVLASGTYADMCGMVPWGKSGIVKGAYFGLFAVLNKAGLQLLAEDLYFVIGAKITLIRQLTAAEDFHDQQRKLKFITEMFALVQRLIWRASIELRAGRLAVSGDKLISLMPSFTLLPTVWLGRISQLVGIMLSLAGILGALGFMNDTMLVLGLFNLIVALASIAALIGLTLRNTLGMAHATINGSYSLLCGAPLIRFTPETSSCRKFLALLEIGGVGAGILGGSYATAVAAVLTFGPIAQKGLMQGLYLAFCKGFAYASSIMFNGWPAVLFYALYRLHSMRSKCELEEDDTRILDSLLDQMSKIKTPEDKLAFLHRLETQVSSEVIAMLGSEAEIHEKYNQLQQHRVVYALDGAGKVLVQGANLSMNEIICTQMQMPAEQLREVLIGLHAGDPRAVISLRNHQDYDFSANQALQDMLSDWVINAILPTAMFAAARFLTESDDPFELVFAFMLLVKAAMSHWFSIVKKPSGGVLRTIGAAIGVGVFSFATKELAGPAAAAAFDSAGMGPIGETLALAAVVGGPCMSRLY